MKQFYSCLYPADTLGTGWWRMTMPASSLEPFLKDANISICRKYVFEDNFYNGFNMVMVQRQSSARQKDILLNYLLPMSKAKGFWTIYNIDDCLHGDDLPDYNSAKSAFNTPEIMSNIKTILLNVDFVLVTTDELKQNYHERFDVPLENIIVIPNFLPSWWIGNKIDVEKRVNLFNKNKKRPRVGIISSPSHFNADLNNPVKDDLDEILPIIEQTKDIYEWVFFGTSRLPRLEKFFATGEMLYEHGVDVFNYPNKLDTLNLQAVVVPLIDNTFNRCKSNIKLLECSALGIPVFLQNICTYNQYAPIKEMLFDSPVDLSMKLKKLLNGSASIYKSVITTQFDFLNKPHPAAPNGWWMDRNYDKWMKLFRLRNKPLEINMKDFLDYHKAKLEEKPANV